LSLIEDRLTGLGLALPPVPKPVAAYIPAVQTGHHVYTSGQLPIAEGKLLHTGALGRELTLEQGVECARRAVLNALAAVKGVIGDLDRVERIVKLTGWVASADGFTDQPKVMNGASELLGQLFGEAGQHARAALGTNVLPLGAPVELELIVRVRPA
jgi:enamine deaminase RidA (YjgF/YER057c/UK114 family)